MTFELCSEESRGNGNDISAAEVTYEGGEKFVNVIQIDPFNLDKEREEGYFDTEGNFVEYVDENEIKVTQALRRLKGTSNKKEKMSAETKHIFEQLTEDAVRLMEENGEYNVYHENQETFECEAEGYARLAQSKEKADAYDMFADDDEDATAVKPSSDELNTVLGPNSNAASQSSSDALNTASEGESLQNDSVYDESSGYCYSSSLGYYNDPSTGLYCSASRLFQGNGTHSTRRLVHMKK